MGARVPSVWGHGALGTEHGVISAQHCHGEKWGLHRGDTRLDWDVGRAVGRWHRGIRGWHVLSWVSQAPCPGQQGGSTHGDLVA